MNKRIYHNSQQTIPKLQREDKKATYNREEIAQVAKEFYQKLYSEHREVKERKMEK